MNGKLILLAVAAVGLGTLGQLLRPQLLPVSAQALAVVLLPQMLDGLPIAQRWDNPYPNGMVEQGALYAPAGVETDGIQLDYFRHSSTRHNGIGCYLDQGERLLSQRMTPVRFADSTQEVDLALTRSADQVRLIAATECGTDACNEQSLPFGRDFWRSLRLQSKRSAAESRVPVSVVLTAPLAAHQDSTATQAALLARFHRIAAQIDLAPARRLAALQSGQSVARFRLPPDRDGASQVARFVEGKPGLEFTTAPASPRGVNSSRAD